MGEKRSGVTRDHSIDGLRGIAILSVIFLHWGVRPYQAEIKALSGTLYNVLNQSAHGVDVFFVVSGYLIGGIIIREGGQPRFLRTFYVRRSLRILPIYFSTVSGVLVLFALAGAYPESAPPWWSYLLFLNNLFDGVGSGPIMPFGPFWSIALEEQFYLVAALTAYRFGQRGVIILGVFFVLGSIAFRLVNFAWPLGVSSWSFPLARLDPIGLGLLLAACRPAIAPRTAIAAAAFSAACIIANAVLAANDPVFVNITLTAVLTAALICLRSTTSVSRVLSLGLLTAFGRMCFSLYILHQLCLMFVILASGDRPDLVSLAATFIFLSAVCWVLWLHVESRLIAIGHRWTYSRQGQRDDVAVST